MSPDMSTVPAQPATGAPPNGMKPAADETCTADKTYAAGAKDVHSRRQWAWGADAMAAIELLRAKAAFIHTRECQGASSSSSKAQPARTRKEVDAIYSGVLRLLHLAQEAAHGRSPHYRRVYGWWTGACTEAAFRNIHNAEALLARLYTLSEVKVEALEAARRAREALDVSDPTYVAALTLIGRHKFAQRTGRPEAADSGNGEQVVACTAEALSEIIQTGHDAADKQRAKLRMFRNVLLTGSLIAFVLIVGLVVFGAFRPSLVPVCFFPDPAVVCPSGQGVEPPGVLQVASSAWDLALVAVMGLLGGGISAAVFIRSLYLNNGTPYNVAVPLALSKLPAGAMTSVLGMILLAGDFVPGFTAVDKQGQVLAYAVLFGFAQQLFTQLLDRRAESLVDSVPTKTRSEGKISGREDGVEFAFVESAGPR